MPTCAYVGLGSNFDDPRQQITTALAELNAIPQTRVVTHSGLYRSAPVGPAGQPDYINAVAALNTELSPHRLLARLFEIENLHWRVRGMRWGPRTLDLDLLLYGQETWQDETLTIPHPRLHERGFVLYPLYEVAPHLVIPGRGLLSELLEHCPKQELTPLEADNNDN